MTDKRLLHRSREVVSRDAAHELSHPLAQLRSGEADGGERAPLDVLVAIDVVRRAAAGVEEQLPKQPLIRVAAHAFDL